MTDNSIKFTHFIVNLEGINGNRDVRVAKFYSISAYIQGDISTNPPKLCILFAQLKTQQKGSQMEQVNMVFGEKKGKRESV